MSTPEPDCARPRLYTAAEILALDCPWDHVTARQAAELLDVSWNTLKTRIRADRRQGRSQPFEVRPSTLVEGRQGRATVLSSEIRALKRWHKTFAYTRRTRDAARDHPGGHTYLTISHAAERLGLPKSVLHERVHEDRRHARPQPFHYRDSALAGGAHRRVVLCADVEELDRWYGDHAVPVPPLDGPQYVLPLGGLAKYVTVAQAAVLLNVPNQTIRGRMRKDRRRGTGHPFRRRTALLVGGRFGRYVLSANVRELESWTESYVRG